MIEDGEFDDDGPGWDKYPEIKKALKPTKKDDGIFWVTKQEFFHFYGTVSELRIGEAGCLYIRVLRFPNIFAEPGIRVCN